MLPCAKIPMLDLAEAIGEYCGTVLFFWTLSLLFILHNGLETLELIYWLFIERCHCFCLSSLLLLFCSRFSNVDQTLFAVLIFVAYAIDNVFLLLLLFCSNQILVSSAHRIYANGNAFSWNYIYWLLVLLSSIVVIVLSISPQKNRPMKFWYSTVDKVWFTPW